MTYYLKICDKSICGKPNYKHPKSLKHTTLNDSIIKRYITSNANFDEVDETLRKYVNIHNKEYDHFDLHWLNELLITTNHVRYFTFDLKSNCRYSFYMPQKLLFSENQSRSKSLCSYIRIVYYFF